MKYVIMCGGNYKDQFEIPKPMLEVFGEKLVERTIRLLKENGITDIAISTDIDDYDSLDVEILKRDNKYVHDTQGKIKKSENSWLTAYYPLEKAACYLAGDVYWTEGAIKKIINTKVKDTMFIAAPDISDGRKSPSIKGREPLGYIANNQAVFRKAINELMQEIDEGKFTYDPIAWNLYRKLNKLEIDYNGFGNDVFRTNGSLLVIDDLTTDIDSKKDIPKLENLIKLMKGEIEMIKVTVKDDFTLGAFNELKNIVRKNEKNNEHGRLYTGDTFECTQDMCNYLIRDNRDKHAYVEVIEVVPEEVKEVKKEVESKSIAEELKEIVEKKTTRKRPVAKKEK